MRDFVCVILGCAGLSSSDAWSGGSVGILATSLGFYKVFLQTSLHFSSQFRNLKAISQLGDRFTVISKLGNHFAAISQLGDHFEAISKLGDHFAAISQLRNECTVLRNGTRVPKGGFAVAKLPSNWRFGCEIRSFYTLGFRSRFAAAN